MTEIAASETKRTRAYPEYKDSGVEWLGEVPTHWRIDRLKRTVVKCQNGLWGDPPENDESDIACVRVADFDRDALRVPKQDFTVRSVPLGQRKGRVLSKGDLLLEKSGGGEKQPVGAVVIYDLEMPAVCTNFIARMPVANGFNSSFLRYLHGALYFAGVNERSIKQSIGIQNLDSDAYLNERVALPPPDEQRAIAAYLDRETERIDTLVAKKERLIELLQEKRTALISRAVTKGLDPDVEMQDSGVEWLGAIPAHWGVVKINHVSSQITNGYVGPTRNILQDDGDVRYLQSTHIKSGKIKFGHDPYFVSQEWSEAREKSILKKGFVLIVQTGDVGQCAAVPEEFEGANCHALIIVKPRDELSGFWLSYFLQSNVGQALMLSTQTGATLKHLGCTEMKEVTVALPPLEKQSKIVEYLDHQTARIDALVDKVQEGIERLKEYRTALISVAVTGQIDVRGAAPETTPSMPAQSA